MALGLKSVSSNCLVVTLENFERVVKHFSKFTDDEERCTVMSLVLPNLNKNVKDLGGTESQQQKMSVILQNANKQFASLKEKLELKKSRAADETTLTQIVKLDPSQVKSHSSFFKFPKTACPSISFTKILAFPFSKAVSCMRTAFDHRKAIFNTGLLAAGTWGAAKIMIDSGTWSDEDPATYAAAFGVAAGTLITGKIAMSCLPREIVAKTPKEEFFSNDPELQAICSKIRLFDPANPKDDKIKVGQLIGLMQMRKDLFREAVDKKMIQAGDYSPDEQFSLWQSIVSLEEADMLKIMGCDPNIEDSQGMTPLLWTARGLYRLGDASVHAERLMAAGAKIEKTANLNGRDWKAYELAEILTTDSRLIDLLKSRYADSLKEPWEPTDPILRSLKNVYSDLMLTDIRRGK